MNYLDLISQIKSKDAACLEVLYNSYGSKFYNYCIHKWMLSEDAAWEIVYQTLETVILKGGNYQFESETHFNNFLFKVLVNFLRQQYRRKQTVNTELNFVNLNDEDEIPGYIQKQMNEQSFRQYYQSETIDSEIMAALQTALEKLSQQDRDLLLLKAQNHTYDEIATMLGIENNQLKVKHHRAKQKLINLLKDASLYEHAK